MLIDDRSVQRALQSAGLYEGEIDGDFLEKSLTAARKFARLRAPHYAIAWPDARVRIAVEQALMQDIGAYGSEIDGLNGPATQVALEKWQDWLTFQRPALPIWQLTAPSRSKHQTLWPRQADVEKFYGKPGTNQVRLESPYPLYLDWDLSTKVDHFSCHELIHDAARRVMERVLSEYGKDKIHELGLDQFGGCLNVRRMRNGSAWSMHAFGIAIDWDADRNQLRWGRDHAQMAKPEYAKFLDLWEEEGFVSLGRARNFDYMHVQAARL